MRCGRVKLSLLAHLKKCVDLRITCKNHDGVNVNWNGSSDILNVDPKGS